MWNAATRATVGDGSGLSQRLAETDPRDELDHRTPIQRPRFGRKSTFGSRILITVALMPFKDAWPRGHSILILA
jgi:hypothetical protein